MAFLGDDGTVSVFTEVADLARYCREAKGHRLQKLEWWAELAELDDEDFTPHEVATFDLRKPSDTGAELLEDLALFCDLDADLDLLDEPDMNRDDWDALVDEVRTCLELQD